MSPSTPRHRPVRPLSSLLAALTLVLPALGVLIAGAVSPAPAAASSGVVVPQTVDASVGFARFVSDSYHSQYAFVVPPTVTRLVFEAQGGAGGNGGSNGYITGGTGGHAGWVRGSIAVTPGTQLDLYVGGKGGDGSLNALQAGSPGIGGGLPFDDARGGNGGDANSRSGGGGGGGAATEIRVRDTLLAVAGGGGGAGGAGGVVTYTGGNGGDAGPGVRGGTGGTGIGAGGGGGIVTCASQGGAHAGVTGGEGDASGGGGGGGGAGYDGTNCGGDGGHGGGVGGGAGGGGGGGASWWDTGRVSDAEWRTGEELVDGYVIFRWQPPASQVSLSASSVLSTLQLRAAVAPGAGVTGPVPSGTVDFFETPDGSYEYALGSASVDGNGVATLTTTGAVGGYNNFVARYRGDATYLPSSTFVTFDFAATKVTPVVSGSADANPFEPGSTGELDLQVTAPAGTPDGAPAPTGTFTVQDDTGEGTRQYGPFPVDANGAFRLPFAWRTDRASYTFQIDYSGDVNYSAASTRFTVVAAPAKAPVVNPGGDQTVKSGAAFGVDGTLSYDPQGRALTYLWQQVDGPALAIDDPRNAQTRIVAPTVKTTSVAHLRLTVTNDAGLSSFGDIAVTISPK